MKNTIIFHFLFLLSCNFPGIAQDTQMIKDINTNIFKGQITNLETIFNGSIYFVADDGFHGKELWKSDGTTIGTKLVKDIRPGIEGSEPYGFKVINGYLYFSAFTEEYGWELWISDGTETGTHIFIDIVQGSIGSNPNLGIFYNGFIYFSADVNNTGQELWKTDGSILGTEMVKELNTGFENTNGYLKPIGATPRAYIIKSGILYFSANGGLIEGGQGIYTTDGSSEGTHSVKSLSIGNSPTFVFNNKWYYSSFSDLYGEEIWVSDGTDEGTSILKDINPGIASSYTSPLENTNGVLHFSAFDPINGYNWWISDGSPANTKILMVDPSIKAIYGFENANGVIYFTAFNSTTQEYSLWKLETFQSSPIHIKSFPRVYGIGNGEIQFLKSVNGVLFFRASSSGFGSELWRSDGTPGGTYMVKDIKIGPYSSNIRNFVALNNKLIFTRSASGNETINENEIWSSDGTENGTSLILNVNSFNESSNISNLKRIGQNVFFIESGSLWKTNATESGTLLVKTLYPGETKDYLTFFESENLLFFAIRTLDYNSYTWIYELWKSDGTPEGTSKVENLSFIPIIRESLNIGNIVYLKINNQLWKFNNSLGGILVKDFDLIYGFGSQISNLTNLNGYLYFKANYNKELWKSDGTPEGTELVKNFGSIGNSYFYINSLTVNNGSLYIVSYEEGTTKLWKSDGSSMGTLLIKSFQPSSYGNSISELTMVNDILFFECYQVLWKSDGTEIGTVPVQSSNLVYQPKNLIKFNEKLYFTGTNSFFGEEIWTSDGSDLGTKILKDIQNGYGDSYPNYFIILNNKLYFTAQNSIFGNEIWSSDGSETGTNLLFDINKTSSIDSKPESLLIYNDKILFIANDGIHGNELWKYTPPTCIQTQIYSSLNLPSDDISTGTTTKQASSAPGGKITATNKITGTANVTYQARTIELNAGFKADYGTVFKAETGGCL